MPVIETGDDRNVQPFSKVLDTGIDIAVKTVNNDAIGKSADDDAVQFIKIFQLL